MTRREGDWVHIDADLRAAITRWNTPAAAGTIGRVSGEPATEERLLFGGYSIVDLGRLVGGIVLAVQPDADPDQTNIDPMAVGLVGGDVREVLGLSAETFGLPGQPFDEINTINDLGIKG